MSNTMDRWAAGPGRSSRPDQDGSGNWRETIGSAPPEKFGRVATDAFRQVDPQDYYRHTQPGVDDTDPFGSLPQEHRGGLAGAIQNALGRNNPFSNRDPHQMSPDEMAQMAQHGQRTHPDAMGRVAQQYQQQPDILDSLLGNKALDIALIGLGAKVLNDRAKAREQGGRM